jgi:arsenite methyltransferase
MGFTEANLARPGTLSEYDSLFERCWWFYAMCREYLFRDHTAEISRSLFPARPAPGTNVLELGCGPGFYSRRLAELHPQIKTLGVDLSSRLIECARSSAARRSLGNCVFLCGDAQSLPDLPRPVDAIIVSRLFLIVPDKQAVLSEVFRVLRPGGRCFIVEPTSNLRTCVPLGCMWILSWLSRTPGGKFREPRQAAVMSRAGFSSLIHSQPWASVEMVYDGWYQYAVCTKASAELQPEASSETINWNAA